MYAKCMQIVCKKFAKIMKKIFKNYAKRMHTHIYMDYARHGEIQGRSLALVIGIIERIDWPKKVRLAAKKVRLETRRFCTYF